MRGVYLIRHPRGTVSRGHTAASLMSRRIYRLSTVLRPQPVWPGEISEVAENILRPENIDHRTRVIINLCNMNGMRGNQFSRDLSGRWAEVERNFRTWHATLHALQLLHSTPPPERPSERAYRRCINAVVKDVAAGLRNTPAVCRKSYINPAVFVAWQNGRLRHAAGRGRATPAHTLMALLRRSP